MKVRYVMVVAYIPQPAIDGLVDALEAAEAVYHSAAYFESDDAGVMRPVLTRTKGRTEASAEPHRERDGNG